MENGAPGQFDDTILNDIDLLMVKLYAAKIKLIIETHDRYALGCWSSDVYVAKYNLPFSANCNPVNDPISFYSNVNAQTEFEARLKHIVSHVNPHFNNTPWSALDEVILSFGIENESQGYMTVRK